MARSTVSSASRRAMTGSGAFHGTPGYIGGPPLGDDGQGEGVQHRGIGGGVSRERHRLRRGRRKSLVEVQQDRSRLRAFDERFHQTVLLITAQQVLRQHSESYPCRKAPTCSWSPDHQAWFGRPPVRSSNLIEVEPRPAAPRHPRISGPACPRRRWFDRIDLVGRIRRPGDKRRPDRPYLRPR